MKRNSLISRHRIRALIFFLVLFCLTSFNFALAQDPGTPDTCIVQSLQSVPASSQVTLDVYVWNDQECGAITIPLVFPDTVSTLDVVCDSISFVGMRAAGASLKSDMSFCPECIENNKNRLQLFAVWFGTGLTAGSGPVARLYFSTGPSWNTALKVPVDTTQWPTSGGGSTGIAFTDVGGTAAWTPIFYRGALDVKDVNTPTKPTVFSLAQNYPNPFNPKTMIRFALPKDSWVKLEVYNILGQKVKTLVDEKLAAGVKEVEWDGRDGKGLEVASGIYFYRIKADDFSDVKKMVMLK
ncbi:MAG: hypothetical protein A2W07_01205 [candidate division Zixibacteria bacterium RBG_16_43_9]|nr:MAG: hypothetical protein A2W07_01205 [candidate division Zixibacteria bacterium RBG_16_43_9]